MTWTKVTTGGSSAAKALSVAPPKDGTHTLQVRQVDKADNKSEAVTHTFHAGPGGFVDPDEGDRTARRLPLTAEADGTKYDNVSFSWRRSEADPWVQIPAGHITSNGIALTAWPVALTAGKSPALVWNATDTVNPDGTVQINADFIGPNSASGATQPLTVTVNRNASGAATTEVGPGSVNLLAGDFGLSATDASAFGMSVTRTASSRTPDKGATQEGRAPIFGAEWVTGTVAELTESDYSHLRKISDTAVAVVDSEGEETHFTADAARTGWIAEPGAENLTLSGSVTGSFTLTDNEGTVTAFGKPDPSVPNLAGLQHAGGRPGTTVVSEKADVAGKAVARPKWIIAPSSAVTASACAAAPTTKGCRMTEFVYATATTATGGTLGDYTGRVKAVRLWATAPGAASSTAQDFAAFAYDASGRLRENPRVAPALKTAYEYDGAGRVTKLTPPGELPWTFTYGQAGNADTAGAGMLLKASRSGLQQGTADVESGTAATSVVYDVPLPAARPHTRWARRT